MSIGRITRIAVFSAVLCVLSPFSVPIGAVPISLSTLIIYILSAVLKPIDAVTAVVVYLLLGCFGLPVFSGFSGGISVISGPTGGFLIGYILLSFFSSCLIYKTSKHGLMWAYFVVSTVLLYFVGTVWFGFVTGSSFQNGLFVCVLPFLPGDAIKIAIGTMLSKKILKYNRFL